MRRLQPDRVIGSPLQTIAFHKRAPPVPHSVRQLSNMVGLRRTPLRLVGCFEAASRTGCAKAATLTHPEGASQILERARACLGGFTDLAVCDRRADADVHGEVFLEKGKELLRMILIIFK